MRMYVGVGIRHRIFSSLAAVGIPLAIAATGCGDAGPNVPADPPVAISTRAGPAKPVQTASTADVGPAAPGDQPVTASVPAGAVKPVNTASSANAAPAAPADLPVATSTPAGSAKPAQTTSPADAGPAALADLRVATSTPAGSVKPIQTPSPADGIWVLDLLDGQPIIEETTVTLRISGNGLEGFTGCNSYGVLSVDGMPDPGPVFGANGMFSLPSFAYTERQCGIIDHEDPDVINDQEDAYISAFTEAKRYRLADGRLEILDGEGTVRLVFVREASLPRHPVDLRGTAWRLITDGAVDNDQRVTTLIFNGRQVTGSTACRDYLASYELSEGSVRFPSISMLGSADSCSESARRLQGEFTEFLTWAWEYSVSEEEGTTRLRITSSRGETLTFEPLPPGVADIDIIGGE